jgi:hypothetical protein
MDRFYIPEREGLPYFFRSSAIALHPDHSEKRLHFFIDEHKRAVFSGQIQKNLVLSKEDNFR